MESPIQTPTPVAESALTAPQSYVDTLDHTPDSMLADVTWTWVRRDPNGNSFGDITVPNPEDHTLVFDKDGTFSAQLDCNNAVGRYATTDVTNKQRNIFMELGPSTTAACGDSSLDRDMSNMFGPVQSYQFEDDGNTLVFIWVAAGPIDYFRKIEQ